MTALDSAEEAFRNQLATNAQRAETRIDSHGPEEERRTIASLEVPKANRADQLLPEHGHQREASCGCATFAQPFAGLGKTRRAECRVEQMLARGNIKNRLITDCELRLRNLLKILHADIGHRGLLKGSGATLAPDAHSRVHRPSGTLQG